MRSNGLIATLLMTGLCAVTTGSRDAPPAQPSVSLPAELQRVLSDYERAWGQRDAAALAALFAEDGFVLSRGQPPVRGRAAIEKHYTGSGGPLALRALAFASEGRVGYIIGAYAHAKGAPDDGKFTLTLSRRADGFWLIVSDMDNGNAPQPAPRPSPTAGERASPGR